MSISQERRQFMKWIAAAGLGAATLPFASMAFAGDSAASCHFRVFPRWDAPGKLARARHGD